jgi:hypothetical protein
MELQLTKEEYQELLRFVKVTFKDLDKDELGDDWWTSHIGYDINIYYDEWEDGYKACAYALKDGTTDTSTFTVITYLF